MVNTVYRNQRKLPSLRKHGLSALLLLGIITLSTTAWLQVSGKKVNLPRKTNTEIAFSTPEIPNAYNHEELPDLMAQDNIPHNVNPTTPVELIGAPKDVIKQVGTEQLQAPHSPSLSTEKQPIQSTGPKTILIDGKSIGEASYSELSLSTNISKPLIRAPIQGLTRISPFGPIPIKAVDGRTVLKTYAKPFTPKSGKSYTALVVGGLGMNRALTQRAINELPGEVTLSFAALAPDLQIWIHRARARGHEVLIEFPMEDKGFDASTAEGGYTLNTTVDDSMNIRNIDFLMSRAEGYFAVTNYGGEVILKNEKKLKPIVEHIQNSGLGFIYDNTVKGARIQPLGKKYNLPIVTANTLLDMKAHDKNSVADAIKNLKTDQTQTIPIGMGFSYNGTIDGVLLWLKTKSRHTELAPVSYALKINK